MDFSNIVILTGAGVSAESGLGTFRDKTGIWTQYDLEDVATPEGFRRNPRLVLDFYNKRRRDMIKSAPNAAHDALARLEQALSQAGGQFTLVTQNVDNLHERAGSRSVVHMHCELGSALCANCEWRGEWMVDMEHQTQCPQCGPDGTIRPDVVWFGEMPYHMERIYETLAACDLFVSIGTSGAVYPAADFVREAQEVGARTMELNLEPSANAHVFHSYAYGPASLVVTEWADEIIAALGASG